MSMRRARSKPAFQPRDVPRGHAALALLIPFLFNRLGVGVTLVDANGWHAAHVLHNVLTFELEHGVETERVTYNQRSMNAVVAAGATVVGEHGGLGDLFVPIWRDGHVDQMLVTGPFGRTPATSSALLTRFRALTGRYGHLADPEFSRFVTAVMSTVIYGDEDLAAFQTLMETVAALISDKGDAEAQFSRILSLVSEIEKTTFVKRMWDATRTMVDPSTARTWASPNRIDQLSELNLSSVPSFAVVGLIAGQKEQGNSLEELLLRDAFQRACVALAQKDGRLASGQIGDYGVMLLSPAERSESRTAARMIDVAERAQALALRFKLRLHVGLGPTSQGSALPSRYQAALAAAEEGLSTGTRIVRSGTMAGRPRERLRELREKLKGESPFRPRGFGPRFERYLEAVAAHTGYRMEPTRLHLESGLERLAEPFVQNGTLDPDSMNDLWSSLEHTLESARTINEVFTAFRGAAADLAIAVERPTEAQHERSLRRALAFIRDHAAERLTLARVARVGGFAPNYFSRLFKQREKMTFERYLRELRIERAKQILARTTLRVENVGKMSGFSAGPYFHRVFRHAVGMTPIAYRKEVGIKLAAKRAR